MLEKHPAHDWGYTCNGSMGLGRNKKLGTCTFWVGTYPWQEYNLRKSSHPTYMGTVYDIRSRKTDDIVGTPITYVIYDQLKGHLKTILNVLPGFSISEQVDVTFFLYEYLRM